VGEVWKNQAEKFRTLEAWKSTDSKIHGLTSAPSETALVLKLSGTRVLKNEKSGVTSF
jgi:hypothetical protein